MASNRAPPDRLAVGLVREELRKLRKLHSGSPDGPPLVRLFRVVEKRAFPTLSRGSRLREEARRALRREMRACVEKNFSPFAYNAVRQPLAGFEQGVKEIDAYYYAHPISHTLQRIGEPPPGEADSFDEDAAEFRFLRFAVNPKQVVVDDFSCNINFSAHALARMISRKACSRDPISHLSESAATILTYVPLFCSVGVAVPDRIGVMIPLTNGLLVGDLARTEGAEALDYHMRRRILCDADSIGLTKAPVHNPFQEANAVDSMASIRISTFLDNDLLSDDQLWCRRALVAFLREYEGVRAELIGIVTSPEILGYKLLDRVYPAMKDFLTITQQDPWKRANHRP